MSLYDFAMEYGTDKSSHGYCPHYEQLLSEYIDKECTLLEMGIGGGGSLRMWREWLPSSDIVGFDCDSGKCDKAKSLGFEVTCGDQSIVDDLSHIRGDFNIIVDDAGHDNEAQKVAFKFLWPKLLQGGWYIIEDLQKANISNHDPNSIEAVAKSEPDVKEVHHICASGGSAILFLKKK
jgi:hypothetical protein